MRWMIWKIQNPAVLERCIELWVKCEQGIKADGFDEERDGELLRRYGSQ